MMSISIYSCRGIYIYMVEIDNWIGVRAASWCSPSEESNVSVPWLDEWPPFYMLHHHQTVAVVAAAVAKINSKKRTALRGKHQHTHTHTQAVVGGWWSTTSTLPLRAHLLPSIPRRKKRTRVGIRVWLYFSVGYVCTMGIIQEMQYVLCAIMVCVCVFGSKRV